MWTIGAGKGASALEGPSLRPSCQDISEAVIPTLSNNSAFSRCIFFFLAYFLDCLIVYVLTLLFPKI